MANALMLGGGAPTLTLEAGALAALLDQDVKFDAISTAGAGMLVGLLYAAPKGTSPRQALENTRTPPFTGCLADFGRDRC